MMVSFQREFRSEVTGPDSDGFYKAVISNDVFETSALSRDPTLAEGLAHQAWAETLLLIGRENLSKTLAQQRAEAEKQ